MLVTTIELLGSDLADPMPRVLDQVKRDEIRASSRRHQILRYSLSLLMTVFRLGLKRHCGSVLVFSCPRAREAPARYPWLLPGSPVLTHEEFILLNP
jgi:hypothetical protein